MCKKYEVRLCLLNGGDDYFYTDSLISAIFKMFKWHKNYSKREDFRYIEIIRR